MKTLTACSLLFASLSLVPACGGSIEDKDVSPEPAPGSTAPVKAAATASSAAAVSAPEVAKATLSYETCKVAFEPELDKPVPSATMVESCGEGLFSGCLGKVCAPCSAAKCAPGERKPQSFSDRDDVCTYDCNDKAWVWKSPPHTVSNTPLVLAFDLAPVQFTQALGAFDLSGRNASVGTDWVSARTPWLALDRNGNGSIDDGAELFGSMTMLTSGKRAGQGFEALADLDDNHDGVIDIKDAFYSKLLLWSDQNQDRVSQADELQHLADMGVESISLAHSSRPSCTAINCEGERSRLTFHTASGTRRGTVIDVYLGSK
jgi:hypothetical protein